MEKTLSLGAFEELSENEIMDTEGGGYLGIFILAVAGAVAIYEPIAQQVDRGNDRMAQIQANTSGEPYTQKHYSIWNNITGNPSYTAYPEN